MANTKPVGVAYSDPELVSGTTITSATVTSPTVSGGTIDNAVIGGTTAAAGTFTTVAASTSITTTGGLYIKSATVAAAGNSQGTAAAISDGFTLVSGADSTKGVILPAAVAGRVCIVKNNTAGQTLPIYPASGDGINAVEVNSAYTIAALTSTLLVAYDATTWYSVPLVAS